MSVEEIRDRLYYMARSREDADVLRAALALLRTHPDAQPNEPLTLEELREMDGQPVWIERPGYGAKWALVNVWAKATNIIYLTCKNGMPLHLLPELESGAKIYCRPPKEEA